MHSACVTRSNFPAAFINFLTLGSLIGVDGAAHTLRRGSGEQQKKHRHVLTLETPPPQHTMVICNAYTSAKGLEVVQVRTNDQITGSSPLLYKQCREFALLLKEGDQFDFKAGNLDVGSFYATNLPKASASLLLVPHRREQKSASIRFESHAFADMQNPQIAVVDAYKGGDAGAIKIIESRQTLTDTQGADNAEPLEERLNFNSVVAINPGKYHVSLFGTGHDVAMPLSAKDKSKYVVMRVGDTESKTSDSHYAQELIVFPSNSGSSRLTQLGSIAVLITIGSVLSSILA